MKETRWWKFVQQLIGQDTYRDAARKAGFDQSAFSRWKRGAVADPAFVLKLARAYNTNVLQALVEAEFITEDEAQLKEVAANTDPHAIPHKTISSEVERRLLQLLAFEQNDSDAGSNIRRLNQGFEQPGAPNVPSNLHTLPRAADSSPDEPSEGDDDYYDGA